MRGPCMKLRTKAKFTDEVTPLERSNAEISYRAATEAIVLLENQGVLPVRPGKIALYGAGAGKTIKGGSGSGEVVERCVVSIREGLENRGFTILTKPWLERYDALWEQERAAFISGMRKKLKKFNTEMLAEMMAAEYRYPYGEAIRDDDLPAETDTCIYVISRQSGEAKDRRREDFALADAERAHLMSCNEHYRHIILVVNTGASFDLSFVKDFQAIHAVIFACQLGQEGGNALADVLTGAVNPSGKLASTWAKSYEDVPFASEYSYMASDSNHAPYREGIYVGYRYYDSFGVEPAYAFGYGMSYTSFEMKTTKVETEGSKIHVHVSVKNTGNRPGKETVQLYVSAPAGKLDKEYQSLAAFEKTGTLQPGKMQKLELTFDIKRLACYEEETASMILEAGEYILRVGNSSRNTIPCAVAELAQSVIVSKHKNLCASKGRWQQLHRLDAAETVDAPHIALDPTVFCTEVMNYAEVVPTEDVKVTDALNALSVEEQIQFCAGTGLLGFSTGFTLPGAVGNTTSKFWDKGIPNATLCDGPAGLRIQRRSTVSKKGRVKPVDGAMAIYEYLPVFLQKLLFGNPAKEKVLYQYVTSFPVAAAIAQTWNLSLAEEVGRAVSREMTEYGVVFWLAPALNIIRNPLCGRNYEYYSEDPLISGKMAAAVTRGVQETPGNYVTIKHFAGNNQEENRYYVSSDMDERTLREIYLRGFEIAVKEAKPKALMTAYNKINGVCCSENGELIDKILRREWGFDGVVMSDWLATGQDRAPNANCIANGMDLIMPGGSNVYKELAKAYKAGNLRADCIRRAAYNVLALVMNSQIRTD